MDYEENDHPIYQHVYRESGFSESDYERFDYLGVDEDTVAYRGMCFRNKSAYEAFIDKLEKGEYRPNYPESFSRSESTARSFAEQKKTYFVFADEDILIEDAYRKVTKEKISGYAGIVIKTIIPKGSGVDINKSEYGVEDEILYMSKEPIKYSYEVIHSYEDLLKINPVDYNQYIQENPLSDGLSQYLMANHIDDITEDTEIHVLNKILRSHKDSDIKKEKGFFVVDEEKNMVFGKIIKKSDSILEPTEDDINDKKVEFYRDDFFELYDTGFFKSEAAKEKIKEHSNHIINSVCEYIEYQKVFGDKELTYDLSNIKGFASFAGDFEKERYKNVIPYTTKSNYSDISEELRKLNDNSLSEEEKNKLLKSEVKGLEEFIKGRFSAVSQSEETVHKNMEDNKKNIAKRKKRGRDLKNK